MPPYQEQAYLIIPVSYHWSPSQIKAKTRSSLKNQEESINALCNPLCCGALRLTSGGSFLDKFTLGDAAERAKPIVRQVGKTSARRDAVIRIANCRVIDVIADHAYIPFHTALLTPAWFLIIDGRGYKR